jgi:hypothetical protein
MARQGDGAAAGARSYASSQGGRQGATVPARSTSNYDHTAKGNAARAEGSATIASTLALARARDNHCSGKLSP